MAVMSGFGQHHDRGGQRAGVGSEALAAKKQQRRVVKRKGFAGLEVSDVWEFSNAEPADVPPKFPAYYLRPWTQLRDEMTARKVNKVGELPPDRAKIFRRTTRWVPRLNTVEWWLSRKKRYVGDRLLARILVCPWLKHLARLPERKKQP